MTTQINTYEKNLKSLKVGSLKADKIIVGKEWIKYSPTFSDATTNFTWPTLVAGTIISDWKYRISGTTLHVKGYMVKDATIGTVVDAGYLFPLPTGCLIRSTTQDNVCGHGYVAGTTDQYLMVVNPSTTSKVRLLQCNTATTALTAYGVQATTSANMRPSINAALTIAMKFDVELDPTCDALAGNLVP